MNSNKPGFLQMIRAPFLSSIIAPLIVGTLVAVSINAQFNVPGFILILIMGVCLHIATNVYNDIYDTLQGTDKVNVHRNEFSGGSGILLQHPDLISTMYSIARMALIIALLTTIGLMIVIDRSLWLVLWSLYFLSAFFSKYYTAAPVKLAYRGIGELSVWFAFGPMAVLVAAVSQNIGLQQTVICAMPATGISTLSILLIGQMIDLDADRLGGKFGIAARLGTAVTRYFYLAVQLILVANIILLSTVILPHGLPVLLSLVPYLLLLPKIWNIVYHFHNDPKKLQSAAKMNVQLHLLFSILFIIGLALHLIFDNYS